VDYIKKHGHSKVALQFPDSLLGDSITVAEHLAAGTGKHIFVLADTVYGSCCVDEVAAEHAGADMIIHYGVHGARFPPQIHTRGCHWFPCLLA
jgi:diphthamide biosynthesis protein 2